MKMQDLNNILDKSFREEPEFQLSTDFAQKVGARIVRREQLKNDVLEYLLISAIVAGLTAVVAGIYYLVDKVLIASVFSYITGHTAQVLLVLFLVNFVFFTDRVLLRFFFTRWNKA